MRITKKVREEAIVWCRMVAAWYMHEDFDGSVYMSCASDAADALCAAARRACTDIHDDEPADKFAMSWLEAAALISDDWNPGDPVECIR